MDLFTILRFFSKFKLTFIIIFPRAYAIQNSSQWEVPHLFMYYEIPLKEETDAGNVYSREKNHELSDIQP